MGGTGNDRMRGDVQNSGYLGGGLSLGVTGWALGPAARVPLSVAEKH